MKLIEKKCPNCGASLEFNENDTSCTCTYCHRSFEIEREEKENIKNIADLYRLNELKEAQKAAKAIVTGMLGTQAIMSLIGVIIIFSGFIFIAYNIFKYTKNEQIESNTKTIKVKEKVIEEKEEEKLLTDAKDLTSQNLETINTKAILNIEDSKGTSNYHSFNVEERIREKVFIAYKKDSNYLIAIYKIKYKDFFNKSDIQTIHVPLKFENVEKNYITLYDAKIDAPEYYFNKAKTIYAYGYKTYDEAYDKVVKSLEEEYTITEKE